MRQDWTPESPPSPYPRRSELPWTYSPWAIAAGATLVVTFAIALAATEWHMHRVSPRSSIAMFALGVGIGLIGLRAMVNLQQKSWPYQALCRKFTLGRFLTLRSPSFSPALRRSFREFQMARGLPPGPTLKDAMLALFPILVAACIGLTVQLWLHAPTYFLAFLGSMLTLQLSVYLWWRRLPE